MVPGYFAEGRERILPERIISTQVHLGEEINITVGKGDKALQGRIETNGGKLHANLKSVSFSAHNFDGDIEPEKILASQGGSFPTFFHAVYFVVSTNSDPKGFLIQLEMPPVKVIPDGAYSVHLEWWGQKQNLTMVITNQEAQVTRSSDPRLADMTARFRQDGDGSFGIFFQTKDGQGASQNWIPQADGTFIIKEVPDRGEKQLSTPMPKSL
jgi:hypothetical protein